MVNLYKLLNVLEQGMSLFQLNKWKTEGIWYPITQYKKESDEIQAIDYSWGEIDFVTKPLNEMRLMECTECEMSAPGAYDIDIEADDINVTDTATVIWEIA